MFDSRQESLLCRPGNLLITVDHQLKITDFGTAEQLDMYVTGIGLKRAIRTVCVHFRFSPDDTIKRSQGTFVSFDSVFPSRACDNDRFGKDFDMSEDCK